MQIYGICVFLPKRFLKWIFAGKKKQGMSDGKNPQKNENISWKGVRKKGRKGEKRGEKEKKG